MSNHGMGPMDLDDDDASVEEGIPLEEYLSCLVTEYNAMIASRYLTVDITANGAVWLQTDTEGVRYILRYEDIEDAIAVLESEVFDEN